jgi:hypothetical protein
MSNLNLNISLPQNLVLELLKEAEHEKIDLSNHIANKLIQSLEVEQRYLFEEAILRAEKQNAGNTFTLKGILLNLWGDIQSPRAFGRKFKKAMVELNIAEVTGKQPDNKLIYTRTEHTNKDFIHSQYITENNIFSST